MIRAKISLYNDIAIIEKGYSKHYLHFNNCDRESAIMYFCLLMFDKMEIDMDCDHNFWKEWIDFYCKSFRLKSKTFKLNGDSIPIASSKIYNVKPKLFYSAGKDSMACSIVRPELEKIHFFYQLHPVIFSNTETITTNVDNEIFHARKELKHRVRLELLLPIISRYTKTSVGVEKEMADERINILNFNFREYCELLGRYSLSYESPISHLNSKQVLEVVKGKDYYKCNKGKESFCYKCTKDIIYYIMGADLSTTDFDPLIIEKRLDIDRKMLPQYIKNPNKVGKGCTEFLQQVYKYYGIK